MHSTSGGVTAGGFYISSRNKKMISKVVLFVIIFFSLTFLVLDVSVRVGDVFRKPAISAPGQIRRIAGKKNNEASNIKHANSTAMYKKSYTQFKLKSGIVTAISRLNYEFSNSKDSIHANDVKRKIPQVSKSKRNEMNIVGDLHVGETVPLNSTRQIIIATSWRSGSSFLGDLLNHYPGTFYYFEPLHYYSYVENKTTVQTETDFFNSLFSCKFDEHNSGFLDHVRESTHSFLFKRHNFRLWNSCKSFKPKEERCFSQDYLNIVCPLYPIRLIKTVRMRVQATEALLRNSSNVKVIVLVRDPRAVFSSRWTGRVSAWCKQEHCADPKVSCQDLLNDIKASHELERKFPGKVRLIRYEDLSLTPKTTARQLLEFLNLPWHDAIGHYVDTHTNKDVKKKQDPYGTARNSTAAVFAWKELLGFKNVSKIQDECKEPMGELGYSLVADEKQMSVQDPVLEKTADQVWPF